MREYLKTWESIFKITEPLSRRNFWIFLVLNYFCFLIINGICELLRIHILYNLTVFLSAVFLLSSILAIIKSMGSKRKGDNGAESTESLMSISDFVKLVIISIAIGGINFLLALTSKSTSLNGAYIIFIYCGYLIPTAFIIFLIRTTLLKRKVTNELLLAYFIVFSILSLIIQFVFMQLLDS
jgi:uncharacterized membrane protein YhaH (DUF805 family)